MMTYSRSQDKVSGPDTRAEMKERADMKEKAYRICREFLSGSWKKISPKDMVFKNVTGGLSNILYYCSLPSTHTPLNGEPSQVLLRMYGQLHTTGHSDHRPTSNGPEAELTTITDSVIFMLLSERKLGPKLYGIFPGGRLEEYIPARAMICQELRDPCLSPIIARKVANVHCLDVPINKEPTWLFNSMNTWLNSFSHRTLQESNADTNILAEELLAFDFEKEIQWLEPFLKKVKSPTVFCHNDLQEGNILLPDLSGQSCKSPTVKSHKRTFSSISDDSIVLIDFEYCSYNFRAFDLANHFCEWAIDYSNPEYPHFFMDMSRLPDEDQRRVFITEYLKQFKRQQKEVSVTVSGDEMNKILEEVEHYLLATHLLWTLWSINNAFTSTINFGYWEYGHARLSAYMEHKNYLMTVKKKNP